jgi:predicted ester cyclase
MADPGTGHHATHQGGGDVTPLEVLPGEVPSWPGITEAGRVVARFIAEVRVTGDDEAARRMMADRVPAHQVVSVAPTTVVRSPEEYAAHVRDMLAAFGRFRYVIDEVLAEGDRVYVRWRQIGHELLAEDGSPGSGRPLTEIGSAVYRIEDGRIAEYWIQLGRLGLLAQRAQQ